MLTKARTFDIIIRRLKQRKICPSGGIGRRTGLKILRGNTRTGSIPVSGSFIFKSYSYAQIAQLVEQWTENPRVTGSIPVLGTNMREWLSGRASPCQGEGREFESRLALVEIGFEKSRPIFLYIQRNRMLYDDRCKSQRRGEYGAL